MARALRQPLGLISCGSGLFMLVINCGQFGAQVSNSPPRSFYRPGLEHRAWEEARVIDTPADHSYGISTGCQRRTLSQHALRVSDLPSEEIVYVLAKRDL